MGGTLLHLQMVPHNVKLNGFSSHLQQVNKPTIPLGAGAGAALVSAFATMNDMFHMDAKTTDRRSDPDDSPAVPVETN
uniref:Uncharacterized protein n=2 Tax=Oryza TaxID=4527 RepID=A0A0E0PJZ6_ORYRU